MTSKGILKALLLPIKFSSILWDTPLNFEHPSVHGKLRLCTDLHPSPRKRISWAFKIFLSFTWSSLTLFMWLNELMRKAKSEFSSFYWVFQIGYGGVWIFCATPLMVVEVVNRRDCSNGFNACIQMEEKIQRNRRSDKTSTKTKLFFNL
jgi:hypothetical protein